ncbi:MAG: transposase [Bacteroidaceae bacterium]|nr:transposase [Bacteroidaceae bacterium]
MNDGKVPMDNNYAEQAIRPFTIARKNFVLIDSSKGATASAMLFSLAETAKANRLIYKTRIFVANTKQPLLTAFQHNPLYKSIAILIKR